MPLDLSHGDFTLPGEAGFEQLTLRLARKWGADTIRDSDGTRLSPEIIQAGYNIYSTLCLVRSVNDWALRHPDKLQQSFLMSRPIVAGRPTVTIDLLAGFFREQFSVNMDANARRWWQVFDRTTGAEVPARHWTVDPRRGTVTIRKAERWHRYTVNFLAYRKWEEISMYNHITNNWGDREHLAAVDPMHPETQRVLLAFLRRWLAGHPDTSVVRFTSMFYNFSWFWGDDPALRFIYSDWGDYAMTPSPRALSRFAQEYGYKLTSEDFVNGGLYNSTHNAPSRRLCDYMEFIHGFVAEFGRRCVDLVHAAGKKAYVFYDDHWIGVEPYGPRFKDIGFDGIIKCVFNAFEVRKCAGVKGVRTHELRLHPYLFPTGLKGEPTFQPGGGGNPALDARNFWIDARRGLIRAPIDRIGLGGYLSLVEPWPDFQEAIEGIAREFRLLKSLHAAGAPYVAPFRVGVLTAWGQLRSWIASGHFHRGLEYNEMIESLAGLPVDVRFLSLDDIATDGVPRDLDVIINCGREGSAWSGGHFWANDTVVERLTAWVARGGGFIGVAEPSALPRTGSLFRMAPVLGLDRDRGERLALGRRTFVVEPEHFITAELPEAPNFGKDIDGIYLLDGETRVLAARDGSPAVAVHAFGKGRAVYFSGHTFSPENARLLLRSIAWAASDETGYRRWSSSNVRTDCAWFAASRKLVVINNAGSAQETTITLGDGRATLRVQLEAHGIAVLDR